MLIFKLILLFKMVQMPQRWLPLHQKTVCLCHLLLCHSYLPYHLMLQSGPRESFVVRYLLLRSIKFQNIILYYICLSQHFMNNSAAVSRKAEDTYPTCTVFSRVWVADLLFASIYVLFWLFHVLFYVCLFS